MGKTTIKPGDYVLVNGEGNEAFFVLRVNKKTIALSNGVSEPIEKCRRIPQKFHKHLYDIIKCYLDPKAAAEME
jgi:hypothetical protein